MLASGGMEALAIPSLLIVGGLLALQAAANVQLSTAMGSPFGASTLQLALGALALLIDLFGWLGVPREPLGAGIALGGAAVLAGAWLIVRANAGGGLEAAVRGR